MPIICSAQGVFDETISIESRKGEQRPTRDIKSRIPEVRYISYFPEQRKGMTYNNTYAAV